MKLLSTELSNRYNYKKLPDNLSQSVQSIYSATLPSFLQNTNQELYTVYGSLICNNFDRIVIGDYGAYVEFTSEQANKELFIIAPRQEYRLQPKYSNVKYIWLTIDDKSEVKIYYQKHPVAYADYKPQKYYVSVYEVYPKEILNLKNI